MRNAVYGTRVVSRRLWIIALIFTKAVFAQQTVNINDSSEDSESYSSAYFQQYNPQTALDLVERIPGFRISQGESRRGFGGSAGNVLVNGARPLSKSGGLKDALQRINASSVVKVNLIRGAASSSEAEGQTIVANVITNVGELSTHWLARLEDAGYEKINSAGQLFLSKIIGGWDTATSLDTSFRRRPLSGTRNTLDELGSAQLVELESSLSETRSIIFSSTASRTIGDNSIGLNVRVSGFSLDRNTQRLGFKNLNLLGAEDQSQDIEFTRSRKDGELALDWSRTLGVNWTSKFITLASFEETNRDTLSRFENPSDQALSISDFRNNQEKYEGVLRGILENSSSPTLTSRISGEIAYNNLDSNLLLTMDDADGLSNIALPTANVVVEELRSQLLADLTWKASEGLIIEAGIGAEYSKISVSGDATSTQSFFFVKPYLSLIRQINPELQLSVRARQTVGQLSFTDFAASASVADDRFVDGNPDLGPDKATRLSTALDWRSRSGSAINIELFHEWREEVLEQVILPSGIQGLSNAGSARLWGVTTALSIPIENLIPGGLFEIEAEIRDSVFGDPITSRKRPLSSIDDADVLVEFRQDLGTRLFSWGVSYRAPLEGPFYFANEISLNRDSESWGAFAETTRFQGVKINFELSGIGKKSFSRERVLYSPDRSSEYLGRQLISQSQGMFATLTLSSNL